MSTKTEVDTLERNFNQLSKRYSQQEKSAKDLIEADQSDILSCLRDGLTSVQAAIQDIRGPQNRPIKPEGNLLIPLDFVSIEQRRMPGSFPTELEVPGGNVILCTEDIVILRERCAEINESFTKLAASADRQLEDVMEMQLAATEFEVELDRLQEEVDETTNSAQSAVTHTQESLNTKKVEKEGAQSRLSTVASELNGVEEEISDNKDHRKIVKVVRLHFSISITEVSTDC